MVVTFEFLDTVRAVLLLVSNIFTWRYLFFSILQNELWQICSLFDLEPFLGVKEL